MRSLPNGATNSLRNAVENYKETSLLLFAADKEYAEQADRLVGVDEAAKEIQALAIACQTACQAKISNIVNRCLVEIDPDTKYTFRLLFEEKRNQTEARCVLLDGAGNETSVSNVGGGIQNILAFGLRVACLMLSRPAPARVLVLDEPFQWLSKEYRMPMLRLLQSLCNDLSMQVVMITHHIEHMACDANIIEIG